LKPSNFQLIGKPRITKNVFTLNKEYDFEEEVSLEIDSDIKIEGSSEIDMASIVTLKLNFFKDSDFEKVPFNLELEIEGTFGWDANLEQSSKQLEVLLKENSPAILYSYLRPIITGISIDANLPPLVIPLMNFREA
jgi:preprotein translocase subunit SecB